MRKKKIFWVYLGAWAILSCLADDWSAIGHLLSAGEYKEALQKLTGALDVGSAVALAILAVLAYRGAQRDDDWITVVVRYPDGREKSISDAFQREECSRSEVSGLLGAIHGSGRYNVEYLRSHRLIEDIKRIKSSNEMVLIIPISQQDDFDKNNIAQTIVDDVRPLAFWNLSNHPIDQTWSPRQIEAAQHIAPDGLLIDIPFPEVDPSWSRKEVDMQAQHFVKDLAKRAEGEQRVVGAMVAGEPVMCQTLVRGLEAQGIPCYSATTRRDTIQEGEEKRSRFEFVQFRAFTELGEP